MQPAYGFASIEHWKRACAADELKANEAREEPEVLPDAGPEVIVRVLLAPCAPDGRGAWHAVVRRAAARRPRRQWLARRAAEVACARSDVGRTGGCADAEAKPVNRTRAADIRTPHSAARRAGEIVRRAERADRRVMRCSPSGRWPLPSASTPAAPTRSPVDKRWPSWTRVRASRIGTRRTPAVAPGPASPGLDASLAVDRPALARLGKRFDDRADRRSAVARRQTHRRAALACHERRLLLTGMVEAAVFPPVFRGVECHPPYYGKA